MSDSLKEKLLLRRLRKKDKQAFVDFYDQSFDQIYRYIFFKVGTKEDAEDLTSGVYLKLWNVVQEGKVADCQSLKPFVYMIARNLIIDQYRKKSAGKEALSLDAVAEYIEGSSQPAAGILSAPEEIEAKIDSDFEVELIKKKLHLLKDEYREVIMWKYFDQMTHDEIAHILGKPKSGIRVLAHRAVKALRELVEADLPADLADETAPISTNKKIT